MKISVKCDYALRCLIDLALRQDEGSVHIESISERHRIPLKFLQSIILVLKKNGLVDSKKGPGGGYRLRKSPREITLADVLSAMEGGIELVRGNLENRRREDTMVRVAHHAWAQLEAAFARQAKSIHLADLLEDYDRMSRAAHEPMYYI